MGCLDRACKGRVKKGNGNYRDISEGKKKEEKVKKVVSETFTFSRRLRKREFKTGNQKGSGDFFQTFETKYMQWIILQIQLYARNKTILTYAKPLK